MQVVLSRILAIVFLIAMLVNTRFRNESTLEKIAEADLRVSRQQPPAPPFQVGRASWYGEEFDGKTTASGEPFNMYEFTAAHPALPMGTKVKVTNLRTRKWVVVTVNDRGPVPKSRIIDLSYAAAESLNLKRRGIDKVRLDLESPSEVAFLRPTPLLPQ